MQAGSVDKAYVLPVLYIHVGIILGGQHVRTQPGPDRYGGCGAPAPPRRPPTRAF